jgi:hypothetical protein
MNEPRGIAASLPEDLKLSGATALKDTRRSHRLIIAATDAVLRRSPPEQARPLVCL